MVLYRSQPQISLATLREDVRSIDIIDDSITRQRSADDNNAVQYAPVHHPNTGTGTFKPPARPLPVGTRSSRQARRRHLPITIAPRPITAPPRASRLRLGWSLHASGYSISAGLASASTIGHRLRLCRAHSAVLIFRSMPSSSFCQIMPTQTPSPEPPPIVQERVHAQCCELRGSLETVARMHHARPTSREAGYRKDTLQLISIYRSRPPVYSILVIVVVQCEWTCVRVKVRPTPPPRDAFFVLIAAFLRCGRLTVCGSILMCTVHAVFDLGPCPCPRCYGIGDISLQPSKHTSTAAHENGMNTARQATDNTVHRSRLIAMPPSLPAPTVTMHSSLLFLITARMPWLFLRRAHSKTLSPSSDKDWTSTMLLFCSLTPRQRLSLWSFAQCFVSFNAIVSSIGARPLLSFLPLLYRIPQPLSWRHSTADRNKPPISELCTLFDHHCPGAGQALRQMQGINFGLCISFDHNLCCRSALRTDDMQNQPQSTMPTGTPQPFNFGHPTSEGQPSSQQFFPFFQLDGMQPDRYRFQEKLFNLPLGDLGNVQPLTSLLNSLWHSGKLPPLALNFMTRLIHLALPFWHALLVSTPVVYPSEACPAPKETLTDAEKWDTIAKLEELAQALTITFGEIGEGVSGETRASLRTLATMPGRGADIIISQEYLNEINATTEAEDVINFQILCFRVATTVVHELAHAAALANSGMPQPFPNTFIGDSQSNEIGFEIEKYLFGGVLDLETFFGPEYGDIPYYAHNNITSRVNYRLILLDWPDKDVIDMYRESGASCACHAKLPPARISWTTSFLHISCVFQNSYWQDIVPQFGRAALHFPRHFGSLRADDLTWNPWDLLQALMPGNLYVIDQNMLVYFVQKVDDPSAQKVREFWDQRMPKNSKLHEWLALTQQDFGLSPDLKAAMERVLAVMDFDRTIGGLAFSVIKLQSLVFPMLPQISVFLNTKPPAFQPSTLLPVNFPLYKIASYRTLNLTHKFPSVPSHSIPGHDALQIIPIARNTDTKFGVIVRRRGGVKSRRNTPWIPRQMTPECTESKGVVVPLSAMPSIAYIRGGIHGACCTMRFPLRARNSEPPSSKDLEDSDQASQWNSTKPLAHAASLSRECKDANDKDREERDEMRSILFLGPTQHAGS
ncbi:uncharacterized protein MYCFIDRAFT_178999 [Pseudocercospora fijiensis CIRAD86]|uniref:Uncharacterized protein n=1 Tax=Pseudocercospora fijiensis (strain CIRAD86) TaxID=383855 RepID=M3A2Y8_PSEFD|nr:uncharacterized protein MYCFIDRAFT_178999 [Pseudocercospora fijiensis CIRAD86]EME78916.1 hypothetical protein MYCFIDRAFT_178999 [Pseudocercospora fijiensis CIRAD86]